MTATRRTRLVPTGDCFCGCGGEAGIGKWFVRGHDITAAAALRALEGRSLAERLDAAGYGPDRSVVDQAVARAGWQRCPRCSYAGPPAGLAAHARECTGAAPDQEPEAAWAPGPPSQQEVLPPAGHLEPAGSGPAPEPSPEPAAQEPPAEPERGASGAAWDLLVPGRLDPMWDSIPQADRTELAAAAARLLTPLRSPLDQPGARQMVYALKAAQRDRLAGVHWRRLLTAPREELGAKRNARADELYQLLEVLAVRHLAGGGTPAVADTAPAPAPAPAVPARKRRKDPGEDSDAVRRPRSSAATEPEPEPEVEPKAEEEQAPGRVAPSGAALGRVLPGRQDPRWANVPADDRRSLGMAARALLRPLRTPVKENRELVRALNAALAGRMSGAHWQVLLTVPREALGSKRNQGAGVLYERLQDLAARHLAPGERADGDAPGAAPQD